jgi:hypothetical protein
MDLFNEYEFNHTVLSKANPLSGYGFYKCTATNIVGSTSKTIDLRPYPISSQKDNV